MKVILKKDVQKLANKNGVVKVSDGYAINFLIPKGLAEKATENKIKELEKIKQNREEKAIESKNLKEKDIESLKEKRIDIKEKTNEKGSLFKGVGKEEILEKLKKEGYKNLEKNDIKLEKPIKEIGISNIKLSSENVESEFELKIESE